MAKATKAGEITAEAVETQEAPAAQGKEPVMYVGPTIPGIGIQNSVYTEIPQGAVEAFSDLPVLRHLFVAILEYPKAEEQIRKREGRISRAFEKALRLKEERKGGN